MGSAVPASRIERALLRIPGVGAHARWLYTTTRRKLYGLIPDQLYLSWLFKRKMGYPLDWNNLQTFSEKIQWMKIHGITPLHAQCSDKIRVRELLEEWGYGNLLIPNYFHTYVLEDITPERITAETFVVKTNHDSGGVFFCRDRATFDWAALRRDLAFRLRNDHHMNTRARHYGQIRRGLIVQHLLEVPGGGVPADYKIFCFQGVPQHIQVDIGRFGGHRRAIMRPDWTPADVFSRHEWPEALPERPASLDRMLDIAAGLSRRFQFVRVDLYEVDGRVWFGELSFFPGGGLIPIKPRSYDLEMGRLIDLSKPMVKDLPVSTPEPLIAA
jgi:hypothetical protein